MSGYRNAAVAAARCCQNGKTNNPKDAWDVAVAKEFPSSESLRNKVCPRGAFLGLCEEGFVVGIPSANYTRSKLNKEYAVAAVRLLVCEPALANDIRGLWKRVIRQKDKAHNQQMDVVVGPWSAGLLNSVTVENI